jgi:hypothetical protein
MRPRRGQPLPTSERGAAMLAALCLAMVFAISLSSYITLCYTSLKMSTRNLMNEHSAELAETGIEQALYAYNNGDWTNWNFSGNIYTVNMTMTASGLVATSSSPTPLNMGNGTTATVAITVDESNAGIVKVTSTGQVALPDGSTPVTFTMAYDPTQSPTHDPSNPSLQPMAAPLFVNAVAALTGNVTFSSAGTVDSYNSNISPGTYNAATNVGYSAVITSQNVTSATATVLLNNAVVNGYAVGFDSASPSTNNWLSYSNSGRIIGPSTAPATSVDSTRILNSPLPYQPVYLENRPPWSGNLPAFATSGSNVLNQTCTLGNPSATATTLPTVYNANQINLASATLTIVGPVVLVVSGPVAITGTGQIALSGQFASLQIFLENGDMVIAGNGITNLNAVPLPKRFAILSTNNMTPHDIIFAPPASVPFYGVIYLPFQNVKVLSNAVIYGSIVGQAVLFSANPTIHYDVALRSPDSLPCDAAFANLNAPMIVSGVVPYAQ